MSRPIITGVAVLVVAAFGAGAWLALGGSDNDRLASCRAEGGAIGAEIGGPFTLTAHTGARMSSEALIDKPTLVYFGYTFCPDFCPTDAATMAAASDLLAARGVAINTAFITIDPARDTPEVLGRFVALMHPGMIGLTGTPEEIAAAAKAYRVYFAKAGDDPDYYLMDHSTFTYLMAPGRGILDYFRHGTPPEAMADRVACYAKALG